MKTSTVFHLWGGVGLTVALGLLAGCAEDPQVRQTTTSTTGAVRDTREAVKQDIKTTTQTTRDRIQAEKDAANQAVTGTRDGIRQTTQDLKTEGAAIKQDVQDIKQIFQEPAK